MAKKNTKSNPKRLLLDSIHDTARGLHKTGLIDKRRMKQYDALCLPPIPAYSAVKIKSLRSKNNISQTVLAALLNLSPSTVRQWEIGKKNPGGSSLKLLYLLDSKGLEALT